MTKNQEKDSDTQVELKPLFDKLLSAGCVVINDETADDPEYIGRIYRRLRETGNHALGDIAKGFRAAPTKVKPLQRLIDRMVPNASPK